MSTVASSDSVVAQRPLDNPTAEEVLHYILVEEIRATTKVGLDSGVCVYGHSSTLHRGNLLYDRYITTVVQLWKQYWLVFTQFMWFLWYYTIVTHFN